MSKSRLQAARMDQVVEFQTYDENSDGLTLFFRNGAVFTVSEDGITDNVIDVMTNSGEPVFFEKFGGSFVYYDDESNITYRMSAADVDDLVFANSWEGWD